MGRKKSTMPLEIVRDLLEKNEFVTPSEIDAAVTAKGYSSKYICLIRKSGADILVNKKGRNVVSYSLVSKHKKTEEVEAVTITENDGPYILHNEIQSPSKEIEEILETTDFPCHVDEDFDEEYAEFDSLKNLKPISGEFD
jgi:hypothetical protein